MSVFLDITAALDGNLNSMTGKPPIAWPNSTFEPVTGVLWVRPDLLPADSLPDTIGIAGNDQNTGIYQVTVFAPADEGKNEAYIMADAIAEQFKPVTELNYNGRIVRCMAASIGNARQVNGWFQIPVEIRYLSYTQKR